MEIRKGPFGHFATEKIGSLDSICDYSREIISENILGHMLPVYINPSIEGYELYYDFSGLSPLTSKTPKDMNELNNLRSCLGDLFLTISLLPDYLLSPASLVLDEKYIFVDDDYKSLSVCFNPGKISPDKLNIASLLESEMLKLLESDNLKNVIKPEEIDKLIYSLQTNDEALFIKCANSIASPLMEEKSESLLLKSSDFLRCIITTTFSLIFASLEYYVPSFILFLISVALGLKTIIQLKMHKQSLISHKPTDDSKTEMLFNSNKNSGLSCLILTTEDDSGLKTSKSIYTDKATIGSDRFLCDIFIDKNDISALHAEIKKNGKSYYIRDLSNDNSTYLDNVRLEPQKDYEIKSGQTLMCSRIEFQIEIM